MDENDKNINKIIEGAREGGNEGFSRELNSMDLTQRNAALKQFAKRANDNATANAALPVIDLITSEQGNVTGVIVRLNSQSEEAWSEGFFQKLGRKAVEQNRSANAAKSAEEAVDRAPSNR